MAVLTVGSGLQFNTLKAAVAASHDGDTIYVQAGTYLNDFSIIKTKISIVGVGGMANFVATVSPPNGKAILTVNTDVTLDHVELSGAKVHDLNGAGVRYQGGNLTITNSYLHDNQDGILGNPSVWGTGTITIDRSEFAHNGAGDGYSHNIYVGHVDTFSFTNSYTHDAVVGHELKSRAANTVIMNDRIFDLDGNASYSIDLPNAGNAIIENNIIQQGPKSVNFSIINYGNPAAGGIAVGGIWDSSSLLIEGNTIINQLAKLSVKGFVNRVPITADFVDNNYFGLSAAQIAVGDNVRSGDHTLASLPVLDASHPWAVSPWDHLVYGGIGDDVVHGTAARDLLVGGTGRDTFIVAAGGGSDTIADFRPGSVLNDVTQLVGYGFSDFAGVKAAMVQHGSDVALALGNGEVLTFQNVQTGDFTANDFTFNGSIGSPVPIQPFSLPTSGKSTTTIAGDGSANMLTGTAGNDSIYGGSGADTMRGGGGDDIYVVDNAHDAIVENAGQGIDTVDCRTASYTLPANVENMYVTRGLVHNVTGNALDNLITASGRNDTIDGGGGNDIIKAGVGADVLTGGAGNDMFVFSNVGAESRITDFHIGQDLLDLRPLLANYHGSDPLADGVLAASASGTHGTLISADPAHSGTMHELVVLEGVTPDMLHLGYDLIW